MNKQDFIVAMMQFSHNAWGGDNIPSTEKSFAEVFDCVILDLIEKSNAKAILSFADTHLAAFESGHTDRPVLTLSELHRTAQIYVLGKFKVESKGIIEEWGDDFASECGLNNKVITELLKQLE